MKVIGLSTGTLSNEGEFYELVELEKEGIVRVFSEDGAWTQLPVGRERRLDKVWRIPESNR